MTQRDICRGVPALVRDGPSVTCRTVRFSTTGESAQVSAFGTRFSEMSLAFWPAPRAQSRRRVDAQGGEAEIRLLMAARWK